MQFPFEEYIFLFTYNFIILVIFLWNKNLLDLTDFTSLFHNVCQLENAECQRCLLNHLLLFGMLNIVIENVTPLLVI
jgi:hypothetical protein